MSSPMQSSQPESFPRQNARTHRFTAGAPRLFTVSPDGARVVFVRSLGGTDVVGRLWELDATTGAERLLADPTTLHDGAEELSHEERARRERMREGSAGIVGYATDDAVRHAVFALSGGLYAVDLLDESPVRALDVPGPVVDPRLSPDGEHVAYAAGHALRVVRRDGTSDRALVEAAHGGQQCGLADFIAAEELDRDRGYWWSPGSDAVIVECVDERPVQEWWISDPLHPEAAPYPHRYPAAGTPNARIGLMVARLDGDAVEIPWDRTAFPYLVDVSWTRYGDPLVVVGSRDQRQFLVLAADTTTGATRTVADLADPQWIDAEPGGRRWAPDGRLLTLRADRDSDTYRLHLGDAWLSPAGVQVRGVLDVDDDGVLVGTAPTPRDQAIVHVGWDGALTDVSAASGWHLARRDGGTSVVVSRTLDSTEIVHEVRAAAATHRVTSYAERPVVTPRVHLLEAGEHRLPTAVLFPTDHVPGSRRLPVVMSPYGGPHHQEVVSSGTSFGEDQWLADQGFAVVVADGRGTPGFGPAWDRTIAGDLATLPVEDQVAALAAVAAAFPDDIDSARVGIRGWSFGGYLAALAVLRRPDVFHAAVAGAPVTDWRLYDTAYTERYLGHPGEDPSPYDACSLIPLAASLERPLLIIHGLTDDNVVVAHTLSLSGALTVAGRPHSVLPLSGVTHMTPQEEVAENKLLLEVDFLRRALDA
ncbi:MAG TPA: prolyl oligopeptidase family serine peptidase [Candidatus Nanopelagicales bacterium]|nr:prolyl oligopeptidase family serine peptidase [Candidatus Nanopelagicales bacterium]